MLERALFRNLLTQGGYTYRAAADAPRLPAVAAETTSWQRTWGSPEGDPSWVHGPRLIVRHVFAGHLREPIWLLHHWRLSTCRHARTMEALRKNTHLNTACRCFSYVDCGNRKIINIKMILAKDADEALARPTHTDHHLRGASSTGIALLDQLPVLHQLQAARAGEKLSLSRYGASHQLCRGNHALFLPFCGRYSSSLPPNSSQWSLATWQMHLTSPCNAQRLGRAHMASWSIHHHDSWHESKPRTEPGWRTRHGVRACPAHCHPTSAYRCHPHS